METIEDVPYCLTGSLILSALFFTVRRYSPTLHCRAELRGER